MEVLFHLFLTSILDEGEWSSTCPGPLLPWKESSIWVVHRYSMDILEKKKIFMPFKVLNTRSLKYWLQCF